MSFTPSRLTVARKRRGLSKTALAQAIGKTSRSIAAYEAGEMPPSDETLESLAKALHFPIAFFGLPDLPSPLPMGASFRAMTTLTAGGRDAALAAGTIAIELAEWIDARFKLPELSLPDLREHPPEPAAEALRAAWQLGDRPLGNTVHLLEAHGIRVFSLAQDCRALDAFSIWRGSRPFVFLNTQKSGERGRFDAAHELGHLVLHRHGGPTGRRAEHEADQFASAFLMPRRTVSSVAPRVPSLSRLVELKKSWDVSVAALAYRLHALGHLSEWHYRQLCIEMNERGYRTSEPQGVPRETSQILTKVFSALKDEGVSKRDVARELGVFAGEIESLVFGLALVPASSPSPA